MPIVRGFRILLNEGFDSFRKKFTKYILRRFGVAISQKSLYVIYSIVFAMKRRRWGSRNIASQTSFPQYLINHSYTPLCELADHYGTDKGGTTPFRNHNYTPVYSLIFANISPSYVLECGIGSVGNFEEQGLSLKMWRDYFPSAEIYGLDVDKSKLFNADRISTFAVDQTNRASIQDFLDGLDNNVLFDIVIDDGQHTSVAAITLFESVFPKVCPGGWYIIEDMHYHTRISSHHRNEVLGYLTTEHSENQIFTVDNYSDSLIIIRKDTN
jgi:hypothetical protein